jgi:polyisoprenoid-binding protein YceI
MSHTTIAPGQAGTAIWTIDSAHSVVEFAVKHMMFSTVKGRFGNLSGTLTVHGDDLAQAGVEVVIDASSIDTRQEQRDAHLRSPDFFDAERWPALTFRSRSVEKAGDRLRITGDLTIRGVTREVVLDAEELGRGTSPAGRQVTGFTASTAIDRREFGLTWNQALETGGVLVGSEVKINIDVQLVREEDAAGAALEE